MWVSDVPGFIPVRSGNGSGCLVWSTWRTLRIRPPSGRAVSPECHSSEMRYRVIAGNLGLAHLIIRGRAPYRCGWIIWTRGSFTSCPGLSVVASRGIRSLPCAHSSVCRVPPGPQSRDGSKNATKTSQRSTIQAAALSKAAVLRSAFDAKLSAVSPGGMISAIKDPGIDRGKESK